MRIPRGITAYLYGVGMATLIGLFLIVYFKGRNDQRAADAPKIRAAKLGEENAIARADSTHHVTVAVRDSLGRVRDSVDVAYRRAQQLELKALQLSDSLRIQRAVTAQLTIAVDTLRTRVAAAVTSDSSGTRYASAHAVQGPITVDVDVAMPPHDSARFGIVASVTPPVIDIDAGCRDAPAGGIRSGYLAASAADGWGTVTIGRVAFTPDVCNAIPRLIEPTFPQKVRSGLPWFAAGAVLTAAGFAIF